MAQTVEEVLTSATDSVTLINAIKEGTWDVEGLTQADKNDIVQRNVDHLEIVLEYSPVDEDDETPDVKNSSDDKSAYTTAVATGKKYITDNAE